MGFVKFLKFLRIKLIKRRREADRVAAVDLGDDGGAASVFKSKGMMPILFSWEQIKRLTMNFSTVIGYGGFSTVYLAEFPNSASGAAAAVKIQCGSERLNEIHERELEILLRVDHPNIVKLVGHCKDKDREGDGEEEGSILVTEYASNGTLHQALHSNASSKIMILPWRNRVVIAFQLAKAMEYLHDTCSPQIVHGDIKASNVLLDGSLNCKLCDFGSAKMIITVGGGFSSSSMVGPPPSCSRMRRRMMMIGSPGYTDPDYIRTGVASKKNDIYSFGVIMLELITGKEAFDQKSGQLLSRTARVRNNPDINNNNNNNKVVVLQEMMVDSRLRGAFDLEEAKAMAALSAACLADSPALRPCAADIVAHMQRHCRFLRNY